MDKDGFPEPDAVEIMEYTPPKTKIKIYKLKIEDSFWTEKKKLIPDYSQMKKIDDHALKAPQSLNKNPSKLVPYLLQVATNEVEKVRVLVRWIANNIAYDVKGRAQHNADSSVEGVLKNGKAVCEGYCNLMLHFCKLAGVECHLIPGQTKNGEKKDKGIRVIPKVDHCWNCVKIVGKMFLLDVTWASGSIETKEFNKEWREQWFLSDPEAFIFSHLPVTHEGNILTEYQQVKTPFTSSEKWDNDVYTSPYAHALGMKPKSYSNTRITTNDSEIILKFKCKTDVHYYTVFEKQSGGTQKTKAVFSGKLSNEWRVMYKNDGVLFVQLRFPEPGNYFLDLMAKVAFEHQKEESNIRCFQYRISYTGKSNTHPFPSNNDFGERKEFLSAGFKRIEPKIPLLTANKSGMTRVKIKLPSEGFVANTYHFTKSLWNKSKREEVRYDEYVYGEKTADVATYYIQCPSIGEYRFDVFARYDKNDKALSAGTSILVQCIKCDPKMVFPHPKLVNINSKLAGPLPYFYKSGLTLNNMSSTVNFDSPNSAVLHIKKTKQAFITAFLKSAADENAGSLIKKTETTGECVLTISKPKNPGYYWIEMYTNSEKTGSRPFAGVFCIPYNVPIF